MNTNTTVGSTTSRAERNHEVVVKLREMPLDHALRRANLAEVAANSRAVRARRAHESDRDLVLKAQLV